jgi:Cu/Ag efflux protein CusF
MNSRLIRGPRPFVAWSAALALVLTVSASLAAPAGPGFESRGRVTGVDAGRNTVTLEHAGIPGLLPAAQSEFPVAEVSLIRQIRTGDRVRFTLAAPHESHGLLTIASVTPDPAAGDGWLDRLVPLVTAALLLVALGAIVGVGVMLWRTTQSLHRRVMELDRELGAIQGLVTDTLDGVRQMARALEDTVTTLRVGYLRDVRRRLSGAAPASAAGAGGALLAGEPGNTLVVVQRGRGELYHAVESGAVGPGCKVIWDRRRIERRAARRPANPERRRAERRAAPADTWTRLGFQLVPGGTVEAPRAMRPHRPAGGERGAPR